jgi:hypothetical protein
MTDAVPIVYDAWGRLFTLGQASVDEMLSVCAQIEATQQRTE